MSFRAFLSSKILLLKIEKKPWQRRTSCLPGIRQRSCVRKNTA